MTADKDVIDKLLFTPRLAVPGEMKAAAAISFEFEFDSHYDILGIPRKATPDQIDTARFALRNYYDGAARSGSDPRANTRLVLVTTAQDVLTKPEKRREYDLQPEAEFLGIQEPFEDQPLDWESGLALIRQLVLADAGDPFSLVDDPPPPRTNDLLEKLLG